MPLGKRGLKGCVKMYLLGCTGLIQKGLWVLYFKTDAFSTISCREEGPLGLCISSQKGAFRAVHLY